MFRVPSLDDPRSGAADSRRPSCSATRRFGCSSSGRPRRRPGFALDEENATDVARICFRLDGLPLALELAAGRLGALGPAAVAERLDDRFRLLRSGSRAAPTRQQTLEATLQWSHDLLEPDERMLLPAARRLRRRLRARRGRSRLRRRRGSTSPAAPTCSRGSSRSRSSPRTKAGASGATACSRRFGCTRASGSTRPARRRHSPDGTRRGRSTLAERERDSPLLDREAANLRAALDTLLAREPHDALRLCVALWPFWLRRIDLDEASGASPTRSHAAPERTALRAEALLAAAAVDFRGGTLPRGIARAEESYPVASELGDRAPSGGRCSSSASSASRTTRLRPR